MATMRKSEVVSSKYTFERLEITHTNDH